MKFNAPIVALNVCETILFILVGIILFPIMNLSLLAFTLFCIVVMNLFNYAEGWIKGSER